MELDPEMSGLSLHRRPGKAKAQNMEVTPADLTRMLSSLPSDQWPEALQALSNFLACGCQVDAINCNAAMKVSKKSGPWAVQLTFLGMRSQQLRPSAVSFVLSMSALGELRHPHRWQCGLWLLAEMGMATIQRSEMSVSACIGQCSRSSQWGQALTLLSPSADEACFNAALLSSSWFRALYLLTEMAAGGVRHGLVTMDTVLGAHPGNWGVALALAYRWQASRTTSVALYKAVIRSCSHARQLQLASQLFYDMCRSRVRPAIFQQALHSFGRHISWHQSLQLLDSLRSLSLQPGSAGCNASVTSCGASSGWRAAFAVAMHCRSASVRADSVRMTASVDACSKADCWQAAYQVLLDSTCAGMVVADACRNAAISTGVVWPQAHSLVRGFRECLPPTVITFTSLLRAYAEKQYWQHANLAFANMLIQGIQPNVITYNALISVCELRILWQRAVQLLQIISEKCVRADGITCNSLINVCEKGSAWGLAVATFSKMWSWSAQPSSTSVNSALSACKAQWGWQQALFVTEVMSHSRLQTDAFTSSALASAVEKEGLWMQSLEMLQRSTRDQLQLAILTVNTAISACQKGEVWATAMRLLHSVARHEVETITYNASITACSRCVEWQIAAHACGNMQSSRLFPSLVTQQAVLDACYGAGKWQQAVATYSGEEITHDVASCSVAVLAGNLGASSNLTIDLLGQLRSSLLRQLWPV